MSTIDVKIDQADLERQTGLVVSAILTQAKGAVRSQTRGAEKDLEDLTRRAVGGNLWKAWASEVRPRGKRRAYEPVGSIFVNGGARTKRALVYFSQPGTNRPKQAKFLAYPTEHAGPLPTFGPDARTLSPRAWALQHGIELYEYRKGPGEPLLLMGIVGSGLQRVAVPFFVLIPYQRNANTMAIAPVFAQRGNALRTDFVRRMQRIRRVADGQNDS